LPFDHLPLTAVGKLIFTERAIYSELLGMPSGGRGFEQRSNEETKGTRGWSRGCGTHSALRCLYSIVKEQGLELMSTVQGSKFKVGARTLCAWPSHTRRHSIPPRRDALRCLTPTPTRFNVFFSWRLFYIFIRAVVAGGARLVKRVRPLFPQIPLLPLFPLLG
jgi:hypothetical protein